MAREYRKAFETGHEHSRAPGMPSRSSVSSRKELLTPSQIVLSDLVNSSDEIQSAVETALRERNVRSCSLRGTFSSTVAFLTLEAINLVDRWTADSYSEEIAGGDESSRTTDHLGYHPGSGRCGRGR